MEGHGQAPADPGPQSPATQPLYPAGPVGGAPPQHVVPHNVPYSQGVPSSNGLAVASLVLGILWLGWLGSLLAVIFGHVALGQINRSGGREGGRGLAIAGLVLGYVGIGIFLLIFVIFPALALLAAAA